MRTLGTWLLAVFLYGVPAWAQEAPTPGDTIRLALIEASVARIVDRDQARSVEHLDLGEGPVPYIDLAEWLASRTAVQIRSYGGGGRQLLSIRGSRPEGVLVLLDGLPINDPVSGIADLSVIPLESLGTVMLVRGTGSARYGSGALGGALVLTTDAGNYTRSSAQVTTGSEGRLDAAVSSGIAGRAGRLLLNAGRRHSRNDFEFENRLLPGSTVERRQNADAESKWISLTGARDDARVAVRYDRLERGVPGRIGTSAFEEARWSEDRWSATGAIGFSGSTLNAGLRDLSLRYAPGDGIRSSDQRAFDGRLGGETALPGRVAFAGRLSYEQLSGDGIAGTPDRVGVGGTLRRTFYASMLGLDAVGFETVLGVDRVDGATSWSPELGVWLRPTSALRIYGRVGQGFRLPTFGDLFFGAAPGVRANPDLRSERITLDAELGFEAGLAIGSGLATGRVAGYTRHTDRPIVWLASTVALWSPQNLDRLRSHGIELEVSVATAADATQGLGLNAGLTAQSSRVGFGTNRNPLPYQPDLAGRVSIESRRGLFAVRLGARFTGSRTTSIAGTRRLPAFAVFDLVARRRVEFGSMALEVAARFDNLFDHRYELIELFPEPGRQFAISLDLRRMD